MYTRKVIKSGHFKLEPYSPDFDWDLAVDGLLQIFHDDRVIRFNPNMLMSNEDEVIRYLGETDRGYIAGLIYDYFVFDESNNNLVGVIKYLSDEAVKQFYPTAHYIFKSDEKGQSVWAIEYFLRPDYWRKGIMSYFVNESMSHLFLKDVTTICAYVLPTNKPSIYFLEKLFFLKVPNYVSTQGQELWFKKNHFRSS